MITLPVGFGYPIAASASVFWVILYQTVLVGKARKASGIPYPYIYAEKAEATASTAANVFNCAQRAHQNTLEQVPLILFGTLVTGLKYPVVAASLCGFWTFTRVLYTIGYNTGDPKKRNMFKSASLGFLAQFSLLIGATTTAFQLVTA